MSKLKILCNTKGRDMQEESVGRTSFTAIRFSYDRLVSCLEAGD